MKEEKKVINKNALNINNDVLEAAIKAMTQDKSQENLTKLLTAVSNARVLVPAELPKGLDKSVLQKLVRGEPFAEGEAPRMLPTIVKNPQGEFFAPAFTSEKQLPKDQKYQALLNVPIDEVVRIATDEKLNIKGILLNPATDKMILHPQFIDALKKFKEAAKQPREIKMTKAQFEAFARKNAEWGLLPKAAFTGKAEFMARLEAEKEAYIYQMYRQPYGDKIPCPYAEEDFSVMFMNINAETVVASIEVPEKPVVPKAAIALYIIWNPIAEEMHYYLIEKGAEGESNVLAGVNAQGKHEELMTAPTSGSELVAILDLIREEKEELSHQN